MFLALKKYWLPQEETEKRMWVQSFLKSVELIIGSKMLICKIADCCPVFSSVIQQLLFTSPSFSPFVKKSDDLTILATLQVWTWKQVIMVLSVWSSRLWSLKQCFYSSCLFSYCHDVSWFLIYIICQWFSVFFKYLQSLLVFLFQLPNPLKGNKVLQQFTVIVFSIQMITVVVIWLWQM